MDTLPATKDLDQALETALLHLDVIREAALDVYRLFDAAHNETTHIAVADRTANHRTE